MATIVSTAVTGPLYPAAFNAVLAVPIAVVTCPADAFPLFTNSLPTLTAFTKLQLFWRAEDMVEISAGMELISNIPRNSWILLFVAAITLAI